MATTTSIARGVVLVCLGLVSVASRFTAEVTLLADSNTLFIYLIPNLCAHAVAVVYARLLYHCDARMRTGFPLTPVIAALVNVTTMELWAFCEDWIEAWLSASLATIIIFTGTAILPIYLFDLFNAVIPAPSMLFWLTVAYLILGIAELAVGSMALGYQQDKKAFVHGIAAIAILAVGMTPFAFSYKGIALSTTRHTKCKQKASTRSRTKKIPPADKKKTTVKFDEKTNTLAGSDLEDQRSSSADHQPPAKGLGSRRPPG